MNAVNIKQHVVFKEQENTPGTEPGEERGLPATKTCPKQELRGGG